MAPATPPPDGGLHLLEWLGGLLAAGATFIGIKKASDDRVDERASAVVRKVLDDPNGALARLEEKLDRVAEDVAHMKGRTEAAGGAPRIRRRFPLPK